MYDILLIVHSLNRWVVLFLLLIAIATAFKGWLGKQPWSAAQQKTHVGVIAATHTQVVLGLLLYMGISPVARAALKDMGAAMKDATLRFWAVEHLALMLLGAVVVHVAHVLSKRQQVDAKKYKTAALGFTLGLLLMLAGIPWPFREGLGRALLPF